MKVMCSMFTRPLRLKAGPPRWTNTAKKYISGFHNNMTWSRQMSHCIYLLSKLSLVLKSALSQFSSWIFLDARWTTKITNSGIRGKTWRKGNLMKHGDKPWVTDLLLLFCLSHPLLLSRQGWAKQQVVQKRIPDMGFTNLWLSDFCTGQAWKSNKSQILKSKCGFWWLHLCYYLLLYSALCNIYSF